MTCGMCCQDWGMELSMAALLATAFAYRNIISLICVGAVAAGMAAPPEICHKLWRYLVRCTSTGLHMLICCTALALRCVIVAEK